jgi:predicted DNA-binding protein YlxM (UPF0122 family)
MSNAKVSNLDELQNDLCSFEKEPEIWVNVKGYEDLYAVSSHGRVKSLYKHDFTKNRDGFITAGSNGKGYLNLNLRKDRKSKTIGLHRLVALHFVPNPLNKEEVNHKDNNPLNNYYKNLEWNTPKENAEHRDTFGNGIRGEKVASAKFTNEQVKEIRQKCINGKTIIELADEYKISRGAMLCICRNMTYYDKDYHQPLGEKKVCKEYKPSVKRVLTNEQVSEIKNRYINGDNRQQIARDFNIKYMTVYRIATNARYADVV